MMMWFSSTTAAVSPRLAPILATIFLLNFTNRLLTVGATESMSTTFASRNIDHLKPRIHKWSTPKSSRTPTSTSLSSSLLAHDSPKTGPSARGPINVEGVIREKNDPVNRVRDWFNRTTKELNGCLAKRQGDLTSLYLEHGFDSEGDYLTEIRKYESRVNRLKKFVSNLFNLKLSQLEYEGNHYERLPPGPSDVPSLDVPLGDDHFGKKSSSAWDQAFNEMVPELLQMIQHDAVRREGVGSIEHPLEVKKANITDRWNLFMIELFNDMRRSEIVNQNALSNLVVQLDDVRWIVNALGKSLKVNHSPISFLLNFDIKRMILNEAGTQDKREFIALLKQDVWEHLGYSHLISELKHFFFLNVSASIRLSLNDFQTASLRDKKKAISEDIVYADEEIKPLFRKLMQHALMQIFRFSENQVEKNDEINVSSKLLKDLVTLKLQYRMLRSMYYYWGEVNLQDFLVNATQNLFLLKLRILESSMGLLSTILHSVCLRYLARLRHRKPLTGRSEMDSKENLDQLTQLVNSMDDYRLNENPKYYVFHSPQSSEVTNDLLGDHAHNPRFPEFEEKIKTRLEGLNDQDSRAIDRTSQAAIHFNEKYEEDKERLWELFRGKYYDNLVRTTDSVRDWALATIKLAENEGHDELLEQLLFKPLK